MLGIYYAGGGKIVKPAISARNFGKNMSASETSACSLQAHEKTDTPIARGHAPEADEDSVHRAAAARPMDSIRDDPAAGGRAQARHPQMVRGEPRGRADVRADRGLRQ